ncbi:xanthine dehydrogenase accessory factor [Thermanaeromonas toyohensis ToBE]|uniref:Xanthine dehydrogenase accessory factor n=1 Tax=Thermanaeromonas toyohensis ToBE TaxID=698762 RepID=A0A1W1W1X4_9FIRM|nr:xanthine dehydrogenase accessory factor [Thermanaeromonas toyohensis ToBE]
MLAFYRALQQALEENRAAVAARILQVSPELKEVLKPGARKLYYFSGPGVGELGNKEVEGIIASQVEEVLKRRKPQWVHVPLGEGWVDVFLEPVLPEPHLLILGGGHVGQKVATLAKEVGYRVTVVDDRPEFANRQLFPQADEVICDSFASALDRISIDPSTYVVIVTRGHRHDYDCLRRVISSPAAYIGMIGSSRKVKGIMEGLAAEGVPRERLARVYAPIGLDIGAETPAEIAVSILAEIIQVYRQGKEVKSG